MRTRYLLEFAMAVPVLVGFFHWLMAVTLTLMRGRARRCPRCDSGRTRWSMQTFKDKILPAFVMPRRCESCQTRFYTGHSVNYVRRSRTAGATAPMYRPTPALPSARPVRSLVPATLQGNLR